MTSAAKPDAAPESTAPTVRDVFAAHALAALISSPKLAGVPRADANGMARQAYDYADALMKVRAL